MDFCVENWKTNERSHLTHPSIPQKRNQAKTISEKTLTLLWVSDQNDLDSLRLQMCSLDTSLLKINVFRDFPGCPVVRTLCFQRMGHRFQLWSGNEDRTSHRVWGKKRITFNVNPKFIPNLQFKFIHCTCFPASCMSLEILVYESLSIIITLFLTVSFNPFIINQLCPM